jgi:hypothetical protein
MPLVDAQAHGTGEAWSVSRESIERPRAGIPKKLVIDDKVYRFSVARQVR